MRTVQRVRQAGRDAGMEHQMDFLRRGSGQTVPDGLNDVETEVSVSPAPASARAARDAATRPDARDAATRRTRGQAAPSGRTARMPQGPPAPAELSPGHIIGQCEIIRLLGRGGMGEVYLARDLRLGRRVAIKRLAAHLGGETERFLAEARATARCHHENIVVIHDVGEVAEADDVDEGTGASGAGGYPFMVLEYLEGQTLRQWLRERAVPAPVTVAAVAAGGATHVPVPPGRAVELMLPVVRALAYAHERGIVHRDLKPENVMLTRAGGIKVLDFGIAKLLRASGPEWDTREGAGDTLAGHVPGPLAIHCSTLVGTLPYMSPEQMHVGVIDHRSDLWSVGIMLFELVTGRHPMPGRSMADYLRVADPDEPMPGVRETMLHTAPGHVSDIGLLADVIDRCLIKDPEHRTASARVLIAELEALAPGRRSVLLGDDGSPFAGLAAFQEADADRFFGRDRDVEQIVGELRSRPLVAVVGPSGAGKSSLVRAGVIPALKRSGEGWDAHVVRPGRAPLAALAGVLAQLHGPPGETGQRDDRAAGALAGGVADAAPGLVTDPNVSRLLAEPGHLGARLRARATSKRRRVLVFVDQLEELYTLGAPPAQRAAFLAALAAVADDAASPLRVIVSMRSDFLDRLTEDRQLRAEIGRGLVLLPPMDRDGMREALLRPVEAAEHRFETPALVDRMIEDLAATPGALPLLQFTATRLWELRDTARRELTVASYERLGGVAGALATHADAVLAGMSSAQQALARAVLERLVTPERTRAPVSVSELRALHADAAAVDDVVQHLATMRLLVIERSAEGADHTVELVHESLIDRWPTLVRWLAENQEDAAFLARLRTAAQEWEKRGRDPGLLWRDAPAREARLWRAHYRGVLPGREQDYLDAVLSLDTRTVRRRRRVVSATVTSVLLVACLWVFGAQREASRQAALSARLEAALASEQAQSEAREQAVREAEAAKQRAQVEAARAVAALADVERARDQARAALARAEEEKAKADQAARDAQQAQAAADQAAREARAAQAEAQAAEAQTRAEKVRAEQARDREQRARVELQKLLKEEKDRRERLERMLGGKLVNPDASVHTGEDAASSDE
jgi:serine/threonine protein kinase